MLISAAHDGGYDDDDDVDDDDDHDHDHDDVDVFGWQILTANLF